MLSTSHHRLLVAIAGGVFALPALAQSADLSYKWREGVTLTYEIRAEITQETESPFGNTSTEINTTQIQTMEVVGVQRGDGKIEVTTDSVNLNSSTSPGGRVSYDSTNQRDRRRAGDPAIAPFAFLVGKTYTMTLNEAGEVESLDGYGEHLENMINRLQDPQIQAAIRVSMTESMFEAQQEQMWHVVPGEELEKGDTWTAHTSQTIAGLGEVIVELEYTFADVDSMEGMDVAVIQVEGSVRMGRGGVPGMRVEISDSHIDGTINFAYDLGLIIESEVSQDMIVEISAQGQSMTQSLNSTLMMELTDVQGIDLSAEQQSTPAETPAENADEPAPAATPAAPPPGSSRPSRKP